jgi:hypothetical protein
MGHTYITKLRRRSENQNRHSTIVTDGDANDIFSLRWWHHQHPAATTTSQATTPTTSLTTTTSNNPPTSSAATSVLTTVTSAPPSSTEAGAPELTQAALALNETSHPSAYAALCVTCHGPGVGAQQYPLHPTWAGSELTPGPWSVIPGSDADHSGRTDTAACFQTGCHSVSWAGSVATTKPTILPTATGPGGIYTYLITHPIEGFNDCLSCHLEGNPGSTLQVNHTHACDSCHQANPPIPGASGFCVELSMYPENKTCLVCHQLPVG